MVELHGREEMSDGTDPSRTVGWFTALTPVLIDAAPQAAPPQVLDNARTARSDTGLEHGLLHYGTTDTTTPSPLTKADRPWVSVNYLGNLGSVFAGSAQQDSNDLVEIPLPDRGDRGPDNPRPIHWEFSAYTKAGELTVRLAHADDEDEAKHLLDAACNYLHALATTLDTAQQEKSQ